MPEWPKGAVCKIAGVGLQRFESSSRHAPATSSGAPFVSQGLARLFSMEAQAWTAIGLLAATLLGTLVYLGTRIDGLGARIDGLGARLDSRIDALDAKLDDHLRRHAS
jgi:hypothetical protein